MLRVDRAGEEDQHGLKMIEEAVAGGPQDAAEASPDPDCDAEAGIISRSGARPPRHARGSRPWRRGLRESLGPDHPGPARDPHPSCLGLPGRRADVRRDPAVRGRGAEGVRAGDRSDPFRDSPRRLDLAEVCLAAGRTAEAISLLDEYVNQSRCSRRRYRSSKSIPAKLGPGRPGTLRRCASLSLRAMPTATTGNAAHARQLAPPIASTRCPTNGPQLEPVQLAAMDGCRCSCGSKPSPTPSPCCRECPGHPREVASPTPGATFNTRSLLGGALLGQKKYA